MRIIISFEARSSSGMVRSFNTANRAWPSVAMGLVISLLGSNVVGQDCNSLIAGEDTISACPGSTLNFDGSASTPTSGAELSSYEWRFSDGSTGSGPTSTLTYDDPGFHEALLIIADDAGCFDTSSVFIQVSPRAEFSFDHIPRPCLGDTFSINATVIQRPIHHDTVAPTPLPDLDTTTFITEVEGFPSDAIIATGVDIATICVDLEHSFMGDLVVELTCPNGDTLVLHGGGGGGTDLGLPVDNDDGAAVPGGCWYYCWASKSPLGSWVESSADGATPHVSYFDGRASLNADTYESTNPFDDLIGCPFNGTWELTVRDIWGSDNGFLCGWNVQFAGQPFVGPDTGNVLVVAPQVGHNCDSLVWQASSVVGSDADCSGIQVVASSTGTNWYTLTATDDRGCVFSQTTTVEVLHFAPQISGPTWPPYGIPVEYSVEEAAGSPSYLWTSNTASVYFYILPTAQAAWTTADTSWIAVKEFSGQCIGTDTLFMEGLTNLPNEPIEHVVVYPNPADESMTVPYAVAPPGPLRLRIIDPIGRLIRSGLSMDSTRPFQLDTRTLPTGSYIVEIESPDEVRSFPFMVIH